MRDAIGSRLPKGTMIDCAGRLDTPPHITIRMTLCTKAHIQALRETCDILDQLMDIGEREARGPDAHPGISSQSPATLPAERDQQACEEAVLTSAQSESTS